jgi:hypothetical protein
MVTSAGHEIVANHGGCGQAVWTLFPEAVCTADYSRFKANLRDVVQSNFHTFTITFDLRYPVWKVDKNTQVRRRVTNVRISVHTKEAVAYIYVLMCVCPHHGMACLQVPGGGRWPPDLEVATNIVNKQSGTADKGACPAWWLSGG